jgi:hypothetical protein
VFREEGMTFGKNQGILLGSKVPMENHIFLPINLFSINRLSMMAF